MNTYILLLRGINVGGKNKLPMVDLAEFLGRLGCEEVRTYIQSGNAILRSRQSAEVLKSEIEAQLPRLFELDSTLVKVLLLTPVQLGEIIKNKPPGFGEQPDRFHSDVIFLIDIDARQAMAVFSPRDEVDTIWLGDGVIYSQRLSAQRTKSRLSKIVGTKPYQSMTIRNWNTVTKLREMTQKYHHAQ